MFNKNALKSKFVLNGMNTDDVAEAIGMTRVTLSRRLSGRIEFTRGEIYKLMELLHLTRDEVMTIFFTGKVS